MAKPWHLPNVRKIIYALAGVRLGAHTIDMRAVVATKYGGPRTRFAYLPVPVPGPGAVQVSVRAAGVNPVDNAVRAGYMQSYFPASFPLVMGFDVAGTVVEVGPGGSEFAPGDDVVGHLLGEGLRAGAYAEIVVASASAFVPKPCRRLRDRRCDAARALDR